MLALTKEDVDFENNQISITKTYYRTERRDIITTPKTDFKYNIIFAFPVNAADEAIVFVFRPKVQLVSVRLSHFLNLFTWVIVEIVNACFNKRRC